MSEMYEGIVFCSSNTDAPAIFQKLRAPFPLRLVRLAEGTFGVYRVAGRRDRFDVVTIASLASELSKAVSSALAVFYDNRVGLRTAMAFRDGTLSAQFDEDSEHWIPLDDDGKPQRDAARVASRDLKPEQEYECIQDAIETGLAAIGVSPNVTRETIKDAFCYERSAVLAELIASATECCLPSPASRRNGSINS